MEVFVALDVAIGLVFMYLLLAILCTAINEWIAGLLRLRARNLETAISRMVDDPENTKPKPNRIFLAKKKTEPPPTSRLSDQILNHPLIQSVKDGKRGPSYIPARRFVAALQDVMEGGTVSTRVAASAAKDPTDGQSKPTVERDSAFVRKQISAMQSIGPPPRPPSSVRGQAASAAGGAGNAGNGGDGGDDARMEDWFNESMERASGWYRRKLLWITIVVSTVITVFANADTITAGRILWRDPAVRAAVVNQAAERAKRARPAGNGLVVQAVYPNNEMPLSDESALPTEPQGGPSPPAAGAGDRGRGASARPTTLKQTPIPAAPAADAAEAEPEETDEDKNNTDEEEPADDGSGLTEEEQAALAQIIGWSRDFKNVNKAWCAAKQKEVNAACRADATTPEPCRKALDDAIASGACVQGASGLEPTEAFSVRALPKLVGVHAVGWFITLIAVSMGAPIWFDTLKLFVSVRAAGKNPDETAKENKK